MLSHYTKGSVGLFILLLATWGTTGKASPYESCLGPDLEPSARWLSCQALIDGARNEQDLYAGLRGRGHAAEAEGDLVAARADYLAAHEVNPSDLQALIDLTFVAQAAEDMEEALAWATLAHEIDPSSMLIINVRAHLLDLTSRSEVSLPDNEPVFGAQEATSGETIGAWAEAQAERLEASGHDPAVALAIAEEGTRRFPENLDLLEAHVLALIDRGRLDEAVAAFETGLAHIGMGAIDGIYLRNELAWAAYAAGNYDLASRYIEGWAKDNPEQNSAEAAPSLDTLGHVLAAQGEPEAAAAAFLRAVQLDGPTRDATYREHLARLGIMAGPSEASLRTALRACANRGAACQLW